MHVQPRFDRGLLCFFITDKEEATAKPWLNGFFHTLRQAMFTRRKFLQTVGEAVALGATPIVLNACAAGVATYRGTSDGATIAIPKAETSALLQPNGVMIVRAANFPIPIVVRNLGTAGFIALSPICSHAGCEVRVMPSSFECPCHGSVYSVAGEVEDGPAPRALQRFPIEETAENFIIKVKA